MLGRVGVELTDQVKDQIEAATRILEFIDKIASITKADPEQIIWRALL